MFGSSTLGSSIFGRSILGSSTLGSSTLGSSTLGSSTLGSSTFGSSIFGRLILVDSLGSEASAGSSCAESSSTSGLSSTGSAGSAGYSVRLIVNEYVNSLWWLSGFTSAADGRVSPSGITSTRTRAEVSSAGASSEATAESAPVFSASRVCTLCATGLPKYARVSP